VTSTQIAQEQLIKIVECFSRKEMPDYLAKAYLEPTGKPSDRWSWGNRVLMLLHKTHDARGIRQWNEAGRRIKKGAKAVYILGPRNITVEVRNEDGEQEKQSRLTGFRGIPVFRMEDTEGAALKTVLNEPRELPPLADVAERWGVTVQYDSTDDGEYGDFNRRENRIRLCTADNGVFWHELAHAAHSRLEPLKGGQDPEQEAIAQLTACVLGRLYGHDVDNFSYHYIKHYAEGSKPEDVGKLCYKVLSKTEKVIRMILEAGTEAAGPAPRAPAAARSA